MKSMDQKFGERFKIFFFLFFFFRNLSSISEYKIFRNIHTSKRRNIKLREKVKKKKKKFEQL